MLPETLTTLPFWVKVHMGRYSFNSELVTIMLNFDVNLTKNY